MCSISADNSNTGPKLFHTLRLPHVPLTSAGICGHRHVRVPIRCREHSRSRCRLGYRRPHFNSSSFSVSASAWCAQAHVRRPDRQAHGREDVYVVPLWSFGLPLPLVAAYASAAVHSLWIAIGEDDGPIIDFHHGLPIECT